jgi:hypothetical protein
VKFVNAAALDTAVSFNHPGTYVLQLHASDGVLAADDTITVTVNPAPPNQAPTVNAGLDATVVGKFRDQAAPKNGPAKSRAFVAEPVALDGTVTDDGQPKTPGHLRTKWSKVSGPGAATFANPTTVDTTASFKMPGTYVLRLTASDGALTASDDVVITVVQPNLAPVVTVNPVQGGIEGQPVALRGIATDDGKPTSPLKTTWSMVAGPGTVTFADSASLQTTAVFSTAGTYQLRLTADDGELTSSQDLRIKIASPPTPKPGRRN